MFTPPNPPTNHTFTEIAPGVEVEICNVFWHLDLLEDLDSIAEEMFWQHEPEWHEILDRAHKLLFRLVAEKVEQTTAIEEIPELPLAWLQPPATEET